jgi:glycine cleavage system H protein
VKAASDLYMPIDGEIVDINTALEDEPELVNSDPYGAGWMIKFKATHPEQWYELLTGSEYEELVESER